MTSNVSLHRLKQIHPVQDLFFKPRTVFRIDQEEYSQRRIEHDSYEISRHAGATTPAALEHEGRQFLYDEIGKETVRTRLEKRNCSLFLARENDSGTTVGYYWTVVATSDEVWHDSFRVPPGCGLVFNAYVSPPHRREGIYRLLQAATHNYLFSATQCESVFTIVEDRNTASIRANEAFGLSRDSKNYLVKVLSINILSVLDDTAGRTVHFVLPKGGL